jgi:phytanoyl-CoA hydroxylase
MLPLKRSESIKQEFDHQGYVAIRRFLEINEVEELRAQVERYLAEIVPRIPPRDVYREVPGNDNSIKQLIRMNHYDEYFAGLMAGELFVGLAELLLGGPVVGKNIQWFNKPAGLSRATPPHQDGFYLMLEPNEAVTMWLALDEVGEDNGCMRYVCSHNRTLRPHERTETLGFSQAVADYGLEDRLGEVAVTAMPGDLLVHHSLTIHRCDENRSEKKRRALGLLYYSATAVEDSVRAREYARTLDAELADRIG